MGVPRLWPFIKSKFPRAINHFLSGAQSYKFDYVYLDANGLLHSAAQEVENYGAGKRLNNPYSKLTKEEKLRRIFELFLDKISDVISMINPMKVLYIAIDGPAPRAKQAQQRERRFISGLARYLHEEAMGEKMFDSASISPGTIFMHELSKFMFWAIREKIQTKEGWKEVQVIFSPPTVPGEGEHKIMDYIRSLPQEERDNATHCMFGPDGDLLMLTLSAHVKSMSLFREDQFNKGYVDMVTMSNVKKGLLNELGQTNAVRDRKRTEDDVSNDFVFIGFFVGNDFIPKIKMFYRLEDGLQKMFDIYVETSRNGNYLTKGSNILILGLKSFLEQLSKYEEQFISQQAIVVTEQEKFKDKILLKHATIKNGIVTNIDMKNYRKDYYKNMNINTEQEIKKLCRDYLRALIWVYRYYTNTLASWEEAYTWYYAPLMTDLYDFVNNLTQIELNEILTFELSHPALPFEQLLAILSPYSANLLPEHFRYLLINDKSCLVKIGYYPDTFEIDYKGKGKSEEYDEHKGVAILPFVDYKIISKAYKVRNKTSKYKYHRNEFGVNWLFSYDKNKNVDFISDYGTIEDCKVSVVEF
jgi:5'-3' exoribonuclease 1